MEDGRAKGLPPHVGKPGLVHNHVELLRLSLRIPISGVTCLGKGSMVYQVFDRPQPGCSFAFYSMHCNAGAALATL
jgi:hypothetical protein